jgi:hypothetical protein
MNRWRYLALFAATGAPAAMAILLAGQVVGCGGSESSSNPSEDAAADGTTEGDGSSPGVDAAPDTGSLPDSAGPPEDASEAGPEASVAEGGEADASEAGSEAGPALDGSAPETSTSEEAGVDATVPAEGGLDAAVEAEAGYFDAGIVCTGVTAPTASAFVAAITGAACQSIQNGCCSGSSAPYSNAICTTDNDEVSFLYPENSWLNLAQPAAYLGGGRIAYDPAAAACCLQYNQTEITSNSCLSFTEDVYGPLQTLCLSALQGTSAQGGPCATAWECQPGLYCSVELDADDAGALGTCEPLIPLNGTCQVLNESIPNSECSYVGNGNPTAFCDTSTTTFTCVATVADGQPCPNGPPQCVSGICGENPSTHTDVCQSGYQLSPPSACGSYPPYSPRSTSTAPR